MYFPFLPPESEESYRALCDTAFSSSEHLLDSQNPQTAWNDEDKRHDFIASVHRGFGAAQNEIAQQFLALGRTGKGTRERQRELALRKVADGIAWQIIGNQLYIARRMYRGQSAPSLEHSNFESVRKVAAEIQTADYSNFALLADLTSFVQVGDLLVREATGGFGIVEVKEGEKNAKIGEFMDSFAESGCELALQLFYQQEGKKSFDQLRRMLRQEARMAHVAEMVNTDKTIDPDSSLPIRVNREPLPVEEYDSGLTALLDEADQKDWAIDIIDDCLFIGAYSGKMIQAAPFVFESWITGCDLRKGNPIGNILHAMIHPLALPLFCRGLRVDHTFDLLFGRKAIFFAVHIDNFMRRATECGIPMRWSTRKEAAKMRGNFGRMKIDNRVPIFGEGDRAAALGDGVIFRILYHGMRPLSAINALHETVEGAHYSSE